MDQENRLQWLRRLQLEENSGQSGPDVANSLEQCVQSCGRVDMSAWRNTYSLNIMECLDHGMIVVVVASSKTIEGATEGAVLRG